MAKDGTMRGGHLGNHGGRPKKSTLEKANNGNPGGRKLEVLDITEQIGAVDIDGVDMPPVHEYLKTQQRDGSSLCAEDVFKETWAWLTKLNCEKLISPQMVEAYAMSVARWVQCEEAVSKWGYISKHPTTGAPIQSPYVAMSMNYMKQANYAWVQIFQIVKENCTKDFSGPTPQDDVMERLLSTRGV